MEINKKALLSVSDKTNIVDFAKALSSLGWEIIATGKTAQMIETAGIQVTSIDKITNNPEILDGRVKTLSYQISSGILYDRTNQNHVRTIQELKLPSIDLIACNLYPFKETIKKPDTTLTQAIEQIDIGGPTMLRAAAKNYQAVTVIVDPKDYLDVIDELKNNNNETNLETRARLAVKVFDYTADYDGSIDKYLSQKIAKNYKIRLKFEHGTKLRYGENAHQSANFFLDTRVTEANIPHAQKLHGKELSFNNIIDANSALEAIKPLVNQKAACIVKHNNPCGYATGETLNQALSAAWGGDAISAFGSVIALTDEVDLETAKFLEDKFVELIVAPGYSKEALTYLQSKSKNLRILVVPLGEGRIRKKTYKHLIGGILEQERDLISYNKWENITETKLPDSKKSLAEFSWLSVKYIKSNAVVITEEYQKGYYRTLSMGAGQPNRVDALAKLAVPNAHSHLAFLYPDEYSFEWGKKKLGECVLSSDAFFPFRDTVDAANQAGIKYIIQPGGSIKDQDSIDACNEHGICMIFTHTRHFNH